MSLSPTRGTRRVGRTRPSHWLAAALIVVARPPSAATAQAPPREGLAASTPARTEPLADLAHRYRLSERYARGDDLSGAPSTLVGPYRVGVVEVTKDSIDTPKGAPKRSETARQVVYLERPVEVSSQGIPAASVRSFERFQVRPGDASDAVSPRPFEGLSAYCRPRSGEPAQWLSLVEGRHLRDTEYDFGARLAFLPHAAQILPTQAVRVGDTWRIPRRAAQGLLGEVSGPLDGLVGKLVELRKEKDGPRLVAVISITGRVDGPPLQTAVNAEALFTGVPETNAPVTAASATSATTEDGTIDTQGALTEIRLTRVNTGLLPGPGRLRYRTARELVIHRQLGLSSDTVAAIPRPTAPVAPTEANANLAYVDPQGRFGFDHPQDFLPPDPYQLVAGGVVVGTETTTLSRGRREGHDLLQIEYVGKIVGPELLREKMAAKWGTGRLEVMKGGEEWLPEAEWPRMKVHRIEAAIKATERVAGGPPPRIHFDGYLIQFGQSASILAVATTSRDNVAAYRREIEQILKTLQMNPARSVEG